MTLEEKAIEFAKRKHQGQLDDNGKNYFEAHLQHVANILKTVTRDPFVIQAGYLHDTLEDTNTTYEELVAEFGDRVANLVWQVTHEGQKDNVGYYFPNLNPLDQGAVMLKFADNMSNLSRMEGWHQDRIDHHLKKSKFWKAFPGDAWKPKVIIPNCMKK